MDSKSVQIEWNWLEWNPGYKWNKDILPQFYDKGITEKNISRCVYVIRANGLFAINYKKGISPTLYIGEGNFKNRIMQHKNWLGDLTDLVGDFSFLVGVCYPRIRNNKNVYLDFEAFLITEFRSQYGSVPLMNSQMENRRGNYNYHPIDEIRSAIMIGKGIRHHWAITPMKSSSVYAKYIKASD